MLTVEEIKSAIRDNGGVLFITQGSLIYPDDVERWNESITIEKDGVSYCIDRILCGDEYEPFWSDYKAHHKRFCLYIGLDPKVYTKFRLRYEFSTLGMGFNNYCKSMIEYYKSSDEIVDFVARREFKKMSMKA